MATLPVPRIRAKKSLGQHFLSDAAVAQKMVSRLDPTCPYQAMVEVGPGTGSLTRWIKERVAVPLYLVELDPRLAHILQQAHPDLAQQLIVADFLQLPLESICPGPIGLIGSFPYHISSQIFFKVLAARQQVQEVVCMVQQQVADRLAARPGSKTYGLLSVLLQAFYKVSYCFTVPPCAFTPVPKVTSAVLHLRRNAVARLACDEQLFFRLVKAGFQQRRKMLRNALRSLSKPLSHLPDSLLSKRAEALSVADFVALTKQLS